MQDPVASEVEFTNISIEGFRWDISRGFSTVYWCRKGLCLGCRGVPGYVLVVTKVCNIFDQKYTFLFIPSLFGSSSR